MAQAWDDLFYLERACANQILALSTGGALDEIPSQLIVATAARMRHDATFAAPHFDALRRVLDRDEPDYAN